jgi:hypothetical protein
MEMVDTRTQAEFELCIKAHKRKDSMQKPRVCGCRMIVRENREGV